MLRLFSIYLILTAWALGASAVETEIDCNLSKLGMPEIVRLKLRTGIPGSVELYDQNGHIEKLEPKAALGGIFGNIQFPAALAHRNDARNLSYARVESASLGLVQLAYVCDVPNSIYCDFRNGDTAKRAITTLNIDGKLFRLNGVKFPTCERRVTR